MRASDRGGGSNGTIVVDIAGVRAASTRIGEAAQAFSDLGRRIAGAPQPEMPPDAAAAVTTAVADAARVLGRIPHEFLAIAQELRVRALWAQIADRLTAGADLGGSDLNEFKAAYASGLLKRFSEPWQVELADAYAKKVHDQEHPGGLKGFLHGAGNFFTGAWDSIKDPAVMIYHLAPGTKGWTQHWGDLGSGLVNGVRHPIEFGKAIANLDALHERGLSYWLGNLAPSVAATVLSGGGAAAVRGAGSITAVDRAGEGAVALERATRAAARLGRTDYTKGFAGDLENFAGGKAFLHEGRIDRDLKVVQYYDKNRSDGSLKWWTTPGQANDIQTIEQLHQKLALDPAWGDRSAVRVGTVPKGTTIEYLHGHAAEQIGKDGTKYAGQGMQIRFRDFDPRWIDEERPLP